MKSDVGKDGGLIGGHPKGLYYLAFTEMWERFSFYGMSALLTLYMVKELLLPENAAQVMGLAGLRDLFEFRGPMSNVAFASIIYGWYAGLVYFTPIVGGWVADRLLGTKRTVLLGVLLMSAGHLAMSFYSTFLVALALLILGSGFLKGNISAQVGKLYPLEAESLRSRGFTIFSTGICVGSASGPLTTGLVAALFGWHAGFAVAAALMLIALAVYVAGQRHLVDDRPAAQQKKVQRAPLTAEERRVVWFLLAVIVLTIPAEISYPMVWSIGILWVDQHVSLGTPLGTIPSSWFASADSIGSILAAPVLIALWAWQARRGSEPSSVTKIGIGTALVALAALVFAAGNLGTSEPDSVHIGWALGGYLLMGLAWMYYWPTMLSIVSRCAPPAITSTLMGVAFLSPFIGHTLMGWVGSFFDKMSPSTFWTIDAAIAIAGAIIILLLRRFLTRGLERAPRSEGDDSARQSARGSGSSDVGSRQL
jgi:POT family proton-dependent oligopeptide transporter